VPPGIIPPRAKGGRVDSLADQGLSASDKPMAMKARQAKGGPHETAGAHSGVGRLEKIGKKPKANPRPQAV
jgi:hypothetical protein